MEAKKRWNEFKPAKGRRKVKRRGRRWWVTELSYRRSFSVHKRGLAKYRIRKKANRPCWIACTKRLLKRICLESQIHISILYASWRFRFQSISLIWSARSNLLSCLCIPCPVPLIWLMGEIHQFLDFNMLYPGSSLYSMDHFLPGVKVICLIYMAFIWG